MEILEILKKADLLTYYFMTKQQELKDTSSSFYFGIDKVINTRLMSLVLKSIDKETNAKLKDIQINLKKIERHFKEKTSWSLSEEGCIKMDNFQNVGDPEFFTFDTYHIERNNGFYKPATVPYNDYLKHIYESEKDFIERNKEILGTYSSLIEEKTKIFSGHFDTIGDLTHGEVMMLINHMGYGVNTKTR